MRRDHEVSSKSLQPELFGFFFWVVILFLEFFFAALFRFSIKFARHEPAFRSTSRPKVMIHVGTMIGLFAALLKSIEYTLFIIFTTTWNASHAFGATCYKADLWWNNGEICQILFTRNFSYLVAVQKIRAAVWFHRKKDCWDAPRGTLWSRISTIWALNNVFCNEGLDINRTRRRNKGVRMSWKGIVEDGYRLRIQIFVYLQKYIADSHSGCIIAPGLHNQSFVDPKAWTYKQWNMDRRPLAVRWSFEELKWTTKISGAVESCRPIHECRLAKSTIGGLTLDWNRRKSAAWWPVYS